jgi:MYXO-CTERM domain-containing protein
MLRAARVPLLASLALVAACSPAAPPDPTPAASSTASAPRYGTVDARALRASRQAGLGEATLASARAILALDPDATLVVDRREGRIVHATGRLSEPSSAPHEAVLRDFTRAHAAALELDDPDHDLALERAGAPFEGARAYRLRQVVRGVPVMRRSVKLEIGPDGAVRTWSGLTSRDLGALPSLDPTLDADQARRAALDHLAGRRPDATSVDVLTSALALLPGDARHGARLVHRVGLLASVAADTGPEPHGFLVTLDAHDGSLLGIADTTRSCSDGNAGTVVTSSETVRAALTKTAPVPRSLSTCKSAFGGDFYLEDHSHSAVLYTYDATNYTDASKAATWFTACKEPACYTVSNATNAWLADPDAYMASDYRMAGRVLGMYRNLFNREGADGNGENLIIESGVNYDNATSVGMARSIAVGKPDYAKGKPSYGVLDVMAHELTHTVSWHEWVGLFDAGIEGAVHGVEGSLDEHMSDMFGAIASYHYADEPWLASSRWAHAAERYYAANYPKRNDANYLVTTTCNRNYYRGTDGNTPRAHIAQAYTGPNDNGGLHTNAVILGRAVYLFTEGGHANQDVYGKPIPSWPAGGPTFTVTGIGMAKMEPVLYHAETTATFATDLGAIGLGDVAQAEGDLATIQAEMQKVAYIVLASCKAIGKQKLWPVTVCASVRNGYAAVGLLDPDVDVDGVPDPDDDCPAIGNPDQADADGDGVGDACDDCPNDFDPSQKDSDGDGVGDACEAGQGAPCAAAAPCQSNFCVDGVCCDSACGGGAKDDCQACSVAAGGDVDGVCGGVTGPSCDDGDACTTGDTCSSGVCFGDAKTCPEPSECHMEATCDPKTGDCADGPARPDGSACSTGVCEKGACVAGAGGAGTGGGATTGTGGAAPTTGAGGSAPTTTAGGTGGAGGAATTTTTAPTTPRSAATPTSDGGCGCRVAGAAGETGSQEEHSGALAVAALGAALALGRRRADSLRNRGARGGRDPRHQGRRPRP